MPRPQSSPGSIFLPGSRRAGGAVRIAGIFLACAAALVALPAVAGQGLGPLTLIETPGVSGNAVRTNPAGSLARPSSDRGGFTYRNDGEHALVTWTFRCMTALNDGRTGWSGTARDGFRTVTFPYLPGREEAMTASWIKPGQTFHVAAGSGFTHDGPFAVTTCGLVAAVFEDGSSFGAPEVLDEIFASRRAMVADLRDTLHGLDALLAQAPGHQALETGPAALQDLPARDVYDSEIESIRQAFRQEGRIPVDRLRTLRERVRRNLAEARGHLRPQDLERLEESR